MDYAILRNAILQTRADVDIEAVDKAYDFAKKAHEGQERYSGEPYIIHPVGATHILLRLKPDLAAIQACLLHDVTEDTDATLEDIEKTFGEEVAKLVKGCEKLAVVKLLKDGLQDEKWKKMFLAMASDVRIVFIKLSDRLHNMQTLMHVPEEKQHRIAKESLLLHAAIASRLGIYQIKSELQDLCFKYLYPEEYKKLSEFVAMHGERSEECMTFAISQIEQLLVRENVKLDRISGRLKHLWSIYQKMSEKDTWDINEIYDLFALRVVLPDENEEKVSHLYEVLGILHNNYIPLQDRFKDYVAVPKPNGYRSLHTTILGLGADLYEEPTEIQIRTKKMHEEAELGIASHWSYKGGGKSKVIDRKVHFALHNALSKVNALVDAQPDIAGIVKDWVEDYQHLHPDDRRAIEKLLLSHGILQDDLDGIQKGRSQQKLLLSPDVDKQLAWLRGLADGLEPRSEIDLYPDKIFALTPSSQVVELPNGATPVDFAYAIHTEVGHKMVHAKANGRIIPLDYELRNGEVVEIGTKKNSKPSRYWLSIAKTPSARAKIKNWFNKEDKDGNIVAGREMLNQQLRILGKDVLDERLTALKEYGGKTRNFTEREILLEALGLGSVTPLHMINTLFPGERVFEERKKAVTDYSQKELTESVLVTGEDDLPVVLSACCKPKPPVAIIGYVSRGRQIRIHRRSCKELAGLEGERFVSAHWK